MAASSSSSPSLSYEFLKKIALELVSGDIEELKNSIQDRIPKSRIAEIKTGIQLISLLKEYRLLSENNLDYLIELLQVCRRIDLANKVTEYRNNLDFVRNAPQAQIEERLPAQDRAQRKTTCMEFAKYPLLAQDRAQRATMAEANYPAQDRAQWATMAEANYPAQDRAQRATMAEANYPAQDRAQWRTLADRAQWRTFADANYAAQDRAQWRTFADANYAAQDRAQRATMAEANYPAQDRAQRATMAEANYPAQDRAQRATMAEANYPAQDRAQMEAMGEANCPAQDRAQRATMAEANYPELVVNCLFKFATGATWLVGSTYLINRYKDDLEALKKIVTTVVLPTGILVREIIRGSIKIIVKATTLDALEELWKSYKEGTLKERLEKVFLTEELRKKTGEDVVLVVEINEEEYRQAKQKLADVQRLDGIYHTALNRFQKLVTLIGLEIRTFEVKVLKSLVVGKIPSQVLNQIDHKEEYSALDLFTRLQEYRFLSVNNLSFLKEALVTANRPDLAERVKEFEKTVTGCLDDAPQSQMNNLPAPNSVLLYLLLRGQRNTIVVQRIDGLKESLCDKLELKPSDVPYVRAERGNQESTFVIFQFPNQDDKIDKLYLEAKDKAEWLVSLGILQLKIEGKSAIIIDDAIQYIKPEPMAGVSYLAMSPIFQDHDGNAIDLILVVEVPFSVSVKVCKRMLEQCQSAIQTIAVGFDTRLAVVTYGNHCETTPSQQTAFTFQALSNDFDIYSHIKNAGQQGGKGGNSGIADALEKVVNLTSNEEVRKEATKLCIFINFLVEDSTDLEYYRCSHGNDAIKLCNTLAENGIPLYIFGVNALPPQGEKKSLEENYFLEGIAAIGGGRYFQLEDVKHLEKALTCVVRHDASIENQGEVTGEIIREEINNNHGVISHNDLPRQLEQRLQLKSCKVDTIKVKGKSLKQVSPIAIRVSWADDLDDAIAAVAKMEKNKEYLGKPRDDSTSRGGDDKPLLTRQNIVDIAEKQEINSELSDRMVRRELKRKKFKFVTEAQDLLTTAQAC